jgi:class 3 adenylate cyclase/tetratricopeptide (TPR) repeat protein
MSDVPRASIATILFTDLVGSTEVMQRVGDESAQHLFEAHHRLLSDAVVATGGSELQWLGDGLMVAFASTADAVRCAIAMQQAAAQQAGGPLRIRVGLNVGEVLRQTAGTGSGYFGTPVVTARRLCDRAVTGQILASAAVAHLLAGRAVFSFRSLGSLELKGIGEVAACEVLYEVDRAEALLARTLFVGRSEELARLARLFERTKAGTGGLAFVVGEPGIGKTRVIEEFAGRARADGAPVLWGRCIEGEAARPYAPFADALAGWAQEVDLELLRSALGRYGGVVAKIAPELRERLPELPEPERLEPDAERHRLLDAIAQLLWALAEDSPVLLVLDDLHWADAATLALLRHLSRFLPRHRVLVVGAYRDVELDRRHPLGDALAVLRREIGYERIDLPGLDRSELTALLEAIAREEVPVAFVEALERETEGNPFFLREVLLHLLEEGKLERAEGSFTSRLSIEEMGIPEGVRQVVGRRLSRLPDEANRLLAAASACVGGFRFDVAAAAAELDEGAALDALDRALEAQIVRSMAEAEVYDFTHALIRHTLYTEMNPSRQVRLHRRVAEELERRFGSAPERALEIAQHYQRSAVLAGAERGADYALVAAGRAEATGAHEDAATALRFALELLPERDARRARLTARLGLALAWGQRPEEAARVTREAGELLAASEGNGVAADYLADAATVLATGGSPTYAWALAERGLRYVGSRRDITWAALRGYDLDRRDAEDANFPGILLDTPERREIARLVLLEPPAAQLRWLEAPLSRETLVAGERADRSIRTKLAFESRSDALARAPQLPDVLAHWAGEYRRALGGADELIEHCLERGRLAQATTYVANLRVGMLTALGELAAAGEELARAAELLERAGNPPLVALAVRGAMLELAYQRGEGFETAAPLAEQLLAKSDPSAPWALAFTRSAAALLFAFAGRRDDALRTVKLVIPAVERASGWAFFYTPMICRAIEALWQLGTTECADVFERNLREKTLAPDFRYPGVDARRALGQLCALGGRFDEARQWFDRARSVLEEQGARPLRALVDLDEARMEVRRGERADHARPLVLLDAARGQFEAIGMPGWLRRAEELRRELRG